ncbi:hypothetical protein [Amphibacillus sediminis]|uniref:hypothetical protein n=1 Tax=Amphibacillus sediminis TaxID=360185 RepID=UPI0008352464|nr:hypothetical protein [Amphibacillus sediminis]
MYKLKVIVLEVGKFVVVMAISAVIFSYGLTMMQSEYRQRLRELIPTREAEQVYLSRYLSIFRHLGE